MHYVCLYVRNRIIIIMLNLQHLLKSRFLTFTLLLHYDNCCKSIIMLEFHARIDSSENIFYFLYKIYMFITAESSKHNTHINES